MDAGVLIVDDEPHICGLVELILSGAGYSVTSVNSGKSAIESIRTQMPSLILLEMWLRRRPAAMLA